MTKTIAAIVNAEKTLTEIKQAICGKGFEAAGRFWENTASVWECACGAPTFQQPCPFCDYYPMDRGCGTAPRRQMTKEEFVRVNFAVVFARSHRNTVAYAQNPDFAEKTETSIKAAAEVKIDNAALWDACKAQTQERREKRLETLRGYWVMYRDMARMTTDPYERADAQREMKRYEREGKELKAKIEAR